MKHYILLDRSGSMTSRWNEMLEAVNEYINGMPAGNVATLSLFDSVNANGLELVTVAENIMPGTSVSPGPNNGPRGMTPLFDAIGRAYADMSAEERGVVLIITDGHENSSREHTAENIRSIVEANRERGIEAVFIGASLDDLVDARRTGMNATSTVSVRAGKYVEAMRDISAKTTAYSSGASAQSLSFSETERESYNS